MKKVLWLILIISIVLTGCSSSKLSSRNIDDVIEEVLKNDTSLINTVSTGYKYYLPNGVKVIKKNNYNEKLYCNGRNYYLYVDIASNYYKKEILYTVNDSLYYSKKINYNDKSGYLEIEKQEDLYKIVYYYNYSKIEAYVDYNNLKNTILNMGYILNSMVYNDVTIESIVEDENDKLDTETFDFYTPRKEGNFIDYINEYGNYEEDVSEGNIGNEENE